jgi:[acyl-carrier-protein] S-malonyltransferase
VVALLFPGQGAQLVGMGKDLAERFPAARLSFEEADATLGLALSRLMWEGPAEELTATRHAQPAILAHSVAVLRVVREHVGPVAYAAGHSLGEFSAYVAAGSLAYADALRLVRRRGELMFEAGEQRLGTMAALLGLEDDEVTRVCQAASGPDGVVVPANYNAPGQVVISGDVLAVGRALQLAREAGARKTIALQVSGAFHSPLMEAAEAGLRQELEAVVVQAPSFPVVSNVTAEPVQEPADARRLLVRQLTSPVRWTASMRTLLQAGVDRFFELGPGGVLSGLQRRVHREATSRTLGTAAEVEAFLG